jgi:RluA family pseudouridine synthase
MKNHAPFTIVYEDRFIVAVDKASGISVTADRFDSHKKSLVQLAGDYLGKRLFIVHRIDQDTSGLVVLAKDPRTHRRLQVAFEQRAVEKAYTVVVHGRPEWTETSCDLPLVPDGNKRHMTIIDKYHGKPSLTRFRVLSQAGNYTVLEARPETGRTHQIRVHLAALGHSVVCDSLYGLSKPVLLSQFKRGWRGDPRLERPLLSRLGLHAQRLALPSFKPDAAGDQSPSLVLEAPLPRDIAALITQIEKCP